MSLDDLLNVIGTSTGLRLDDTSLDGALQLTPGPRTAPIDARSLRAALPKLGLTPEQLDPYLKLMVMAIYADDNKDEDEIRFLEALRREARTLTDGSDNIDLTALFEWATLTLSGPSEALQTALANIAIAFPQEEQRHKVYIHVLVLLMLDSLKAEEVQFAHMLGDAFGLPHAVRNQLNRKASKLVPT